MSILHIFHIVEVCFTSPLPPCYIMLYLKTIERIQVQEWVKSSDVSQDLLQTLEAYINNKVSWNYYLEQFIE